MKLTNYSQRTVEMESWQVQLTSYQLGRIHHCTAGNASNCAPHLPGSTHRQTV
ncbi:MAG: hypothetical protein JJE04_25235 [Acidobacteriia bacterium]|nr:hypothetical protein [Terriglobia bacterium]